METIKALVCRPGKDPAVEELEDQFELWQKLVRGDGQRLGHIEIVHLHNGVFMICNEDGRMSCNFNREVPGIAPEVNESAFSYVAKPKDAAAPGTVGVHRVYGTFALVRKKPSGRGGLGILSLSDEDVERWTGALKWMAT